MKLSIIIFNNFDFIKTRYLCASLLKIKELIPLIFDRLSIVFNIAVQVVSVSFENRSKSIEKVVVSESKI